MENLFKNPHSEVPDELWKVASPFERQMAAVEYWAELRRPTKTASNMLPVGTAAAGGVLGGLGGYFSTDDKEKRKKRALLGAAGGTLLGGVGGALLKPKPKPMYVPRPDIDNTPFNPSTYDKPERIDFVRQQLKQHQQDMLDYQLSLQMVKHNADRNEVRQKLMNNREFRLAAPPLVLFNDDITWRTGELENLIHHVSPSLGFNVPTGKGVVDNRAHEASRAWAEAEAAKQVAGLSKTASKSKVSQRIIEFLKNKKNIDKLMAGTGATMGVGGSLYLSKKKPQDTELDVGGNTRTKTPSREQLSLRAQRASVEERRSRGDLSNISDKTQQLKERIARMRADNPASAAALQGLLMGGIGYGVSKHVGKNM